MVQIGMLLYAIQQNLAMGFSTRGKDEMKNCLSSVIEGNENLV